MNKDELYTNLDHLENDLKRLLDQVGIMKQELTEIVDDLEVENQHVRERLQKLELEQAQPALKEDHNEQLSNSRRQLEELYAEGYHICPSSYGAKRVGECLFCNDILYNNHK